MKTMSEQQGINTAKPQDSALGTQSEHLVSGRVDAIVMWREYAVEKPRKLTWGHYENYIVATENDAGTRQVFECSWMGGRWHRRFDGCSEVTNVKWWCEKPLSPLDT